MAAPSNMTWGRMSRDAIKMKSNTGCRYTYHSVVWPGCQSGTCENISQQRLLSFNIKRVLPPPGFKTCYPHYSTMAGYGGKRRKTVCFLQSASSELVLKIILWPSSKVIHKTLTAEESPVDRRKEQRCRDIDRKVRVCLSFVREKLRCVKWRLSPGNQKGRLFVCGPWGRKVRKRVHSGRPCAKPYKISIWNEQISKEDWRSLTKRTKISLLQWSRHSRHRVLHSVWRWSVAHHDTKHTLVGKDLRC